MLKTSKEVIGESVDPFGTLEELNELQQRQTAAPSCPRCSASGDVHPDYGLVSWDPLPDWVQEAVDKGETPFYCLSCGNQWFGLWDSKAPIKYLGMAGNELAVLNRRNETWLGSAKLLILGLAATVSFAMVSFWFFG